MLLLIGLEDPSAKPSNFRFSDGTVSTVEIEVPNEVDFGASNLALCSTSVGGEEACSEIRQRKMTHRTCF